MKDVSSYGPAVEAVVADEDDIDLFGDDDEEEEVEQLKQKRLDEYKAKKATSNSCNPIFSF